MTPSAPGVGGHHCPAPSLSPGPPHKSPELGVQAQACWASQGVSLTSCGPASKERGCGGFLGEAGSERPALCSREPGWECMQLSG